jgi:predicted lactoylglutathione lyase
MDPQDQGFMHGWGFYDLDGHHWKVKTQPSSARPDSE